MIWQIIINGCHICLRNKLAIRIHIQILLEIIIVSLEKENLKTNKIVTL